MLKSPHYDVPPLDGDCDATGDRIKMRASNMATEQWTDEKNRFKYLGWAMFFICAFVIFISFVPSPGAADLYSFVDEEGVTYYTNIPGAGRAKILLPMKESITKPASDSFRQQQS